MDCPAVKAIGADAERIQPNDLRVIARTIRIIATVERPAASLKES